MAAHSILAMLCEYDFKKISSTFAGPNGNELSDLISTTELVFPVAFLYITKLPSPHQF